MVAWIGNALEVAAVAVSEERRGPAPDRLAVPEHLARTAVAEDTSPAGSPDAVSKDGFLNNKDTLQMSPLLTESYFEIAEAAREPFHRRSDS